MEIDQPIDGWGATTARASGAAGLADLIPTPRAVVDASPNRVVVDCVAVANEHDFFITHRCCKSNSTNSDS